MIVISVIAPDGVQTILREISDTFTGVRITSLTPTVLADTRKNEFPTWRRSLFHILQTDAKIVINVISYATPESITDFVRSVRALNSSASPYVFTTDPTLIDTCSQVNGMYSIETLKRIVIDYEGVIQ